MQSTSTPHPKGKGKRGYLVIDCTYCAHHPSNPHRSHLGLAAVPGHVRRSPAPRTAPSRSARTRRRRRHGYPQTPRIHSCGEKKEDRKSQQSVNSSPNHTAWCVCVFIHTELAVVSSACCSKHKDAMLAMRHLAHEQREKF